MAAPPSAILSVPEKAAHRRPHGWEQMTLTLDVPAGARKPGDTKFAVLEFREKDGSPAPDQKRHSQTPASGDDDKKKVHSISLLLTRPSASNLEKG